MDINNILNKLWVYKAWAGNPDYQNYSAVKEEVTEPEETTPVEPDENTENNPEEDSPVE